MGASDTAGIFRHAFLYSGGVVTDLDSLGTGLSAANSINDAGEVVGAHYFPLAYDPFLYYGGIMTDLNSLLPANSGWQLADATAINDSGQIVGYGIGPDGQTDAFLLDTGSPTPEPASLVLFAGGIAFLVLTRNNLQRS